MLYFAYGSNLNLRRMAERCPHAKPLIAFKLPDHRLVFRGVADCVPDTGSQISGGVWRITAGCERALDVYEGVKIGMYRKVLMPVEAPDDDEMLVYAMEREGVMPPTRSYLNTIVEGYRDFGLATAPLREAVKASWTDRDITDDMQERRKRDNVAARAFSKAVPILKARSVTLKAYQPPKPAPRPRKPAPQAIAAGANGRKYFRTLAEWQEYTGHGQS